MRLSHVVAALTVAAVTIAAVGSPISAVGSDAEVGPAVAAAVVRPEPVAKPPFPANTVVQRYCVSCHNPRQLRGNLDLTGYDVDSAPARLDVSEKMIRKLRAQMMPPPGSKRPRAILARRCSPKRLEKIIDKRRATQSGLAHVPAAQPRRIRARGARPARRRDRRRRLSAARHEERELRQHRRRAVAVADAARGIPQRGGRREPHGAGRSRRAARFRRAIRRRSSRRSIPGITSRARRTAREAASSRRTRSRPTAMYTFRVEVRGGIGTKLEDIDVSIDGERVALLHYERGSNASLASADAPQGAD